MAAEWTKGALVAAEGKWRPCAHNALLLLRNHERAKDRIRLNVFTNELEVRGAFDQRLALDDSWRPIADVDATVLRSEFDRYCSFSRELVLDALSAIAEENPVHPVREYLAALQWDGTPRVERLFTEYFISEDQPLHREAGLRFTVGAVARVMRPGCKLDTLPVFEGEQGLFKSSGVAALVPDRRWFSDTPFDLNSKDAYQSLHGVWIYEIGELSSFSKAETTRLKNFLSSAVDRYRAPYGRFVKAHQRQCVFVGTTNEKDYVMDSTGERRKWPVPITHVDLEAIARDRDQIWAEARVRFEAGERWYLEGESAKAMAAEAMERYVEDPLLDDIREALATRRAKDADPAFVANRELRELVYTAASGGQADARRFAKAMRGLGYVSKVARTAKGVERGWVLADSAKKC